MNKRTKITLVSGFVGILIGLFIVLVVSFIFNENLLRFHPRNCAEYIQSFYDMGGRYYGKAFDEDMIKRGDRIQKVCDEQFPKYFPWDFPSNQKSEVAPLMSCMPVAFLAKLTGMSKCNQDSIRTYKSENGYFAIDLPSRMRMVERKEEKRDGGTTHGEVLFTFGEFDENSPSGLVVVYGKPRIDGKGGGCPDEEGEVAHKTEVIAGQKVEVCDKEGFFNAQYFVHPSRKAEYWVDTVGLSTEQIKIVSEAVRKTLRFE